MVIKRNRLTSKASKFIVAFALIGITYTLAPAKTTTCFKEPEKINKTEMQCLAENVYHEARGEPWEGQLMVARVTLNRVKQFGSICKAVYAPNQFSWTSAPKEILDYTAFEIAKAAASAARFVVSPATHFHTTKVNPKWANKLTKLETINNHVFYKI